LERLSTLEVLLLVLGVVVGLAVLAALSGGLLVRVGRRQPWVIRRANRLTEAAIGLVKRPLTIVVLDEVAAVIQTGHYTKNISDALLENHDELKSLVADKMRRDPNVRLIGKIPGYDAVVSQVSETTLRVVIEMLGDPRMDELVSDLLRNNIQQIKVAVRQRQHEEIGEPDPADPVPPSVRRQLWR
jgi:hypothetical protein